MKCARVASESPAERRGRPSGAPAACVGGRAAGGGARRPSHPPPHDECRHPLPPLPLPLPLPPPLHDIAPCCSFACRAMSLPQPLTCRATPPLQSFTCRTASPAATFCRSATSLPVPRLSQSKRMAIYQRNARSGETAGAKNREMHDFQSQLDASAFANLLRPGETPLVVFK